MQLIMLFSDFINFAMQSSVVIDKIKINAINVPKYQI